MIPPIATRHFSMENTKRRVPAAPSPTLASKGAGAPLESARTLGAVTEHVVTLKGIEVFPARCRTVRRLLQRQADRSHLALLLFSGAKFMICDFEVGRGECRTRARAEGHGKHRNCDTSHHASWTTESYLEPSHRQHAFPRLAPANRSGRERMGPPTPTTVVVNVSSRTHDADDRQPTEVARHFEARKTSESR